MINNFINYYFLETEKILKQITGDSLAVKIEKTSEEKTDIGSIFSTYRVFAHAVEKKFLKTALNYFDFLTFYFFHLDHLDHYVFLHYNNSMQIISVTEEEFLNNNKKQLFIDTESSSMGLSYRYEEYIVSVDFVVKLMFLTKLFNSNDYIANSFYLRIENDKLTLYKAGGYFSRSSKEEVFKKQISLVSYVDNFFHKMGYTKSFHENRITKFFETYRELKDFSNSKKIFFSLYKPDYYTYTENSYKGAVQFVKEIEDKNKLFDKCYVTIKVIVEVSSTDY